MSSATPIPIIPTLKLSPLQPTPQKRHSHTFLPYHSRHLILFAGHSGGSNLTNDLWMYSPIQSRESSQNSDNVTLNPATTWKRMGNSVASNNNVSSASMQPSKRHCHAAAIYKNYLVVFGGDSGGNEILNDMWILDLRSSGKNPSAVHQWQRVEYQNATTSHQSNHQHHHNPSVPKPRYAHSCVVIRDSMYLFGGFTRQTTRAGGMYLDDLWKFHFPSRTWHQITVPSSQPKPSKRCYHTAVVYDETNILVFGGSTMGSQYLNDAWLFDTRAEQWRLVQIREQNEYDNGSQSSRRSGGTKSTRKTSIQDIREEQSAPVARAKHAATIYEQNLMFVSGGYSGLFRENDFWMLHIEENSEERVVGKWYRLDGAPQSAHKLPVARDSHAIAMLGKHLFLFGGCGTGKLLNDLWTFDMTRVIQHFPPLQQRSRHELSRDTVSSHNGTPYTRHSSSPVHDHSYLTSDTGVSPLQRGVHHSTSSSVNQHHDYSYEPQDDTESSMMEEEFFGQLSVALQDEERKRLSSGGVHQRASPETSSNSYHSSPRDSTTPSRDQVDYSRDTVHSPLSAPNASLAYEAQQNVVLRNTDTRAPQDSISLQRLSALEQQIQLLMQRQEQEEQRNQEFRDQVVKELQMAKNIMKKQGEALEGLETVVHKEIQTRVAGEDKTQAYFNFISSQQANALALQTHQYQSSVERISQILQHLMKNNKGGGSGASVTVASAIQNLPVATPSEE